MIHRCHASPQIGAGHFFRQLALAEAAKTREREPLMVVTGLTEDLADQAGAVGVPVEALSTDVGNENDVRCLAQFARARGNAAVVVDGYRFGSDYYRRLDEIFDVVAAVDDLGQQAFPVDVLINVNPHASELNYPHPRQRLLGPQYALLREQFAEARERIEEQGGPAIPEEVRRVLIAFGGGDPGRMAATALTALEQACYQGRIDLVLGPASGQQSEIDGSRHALDLHVHRNASDVVELMEGQHLAMSAAGGTTWELACLGVPMMQTVVAENQRPIARAMEKQGITVRTGTSSSVNADRLAYLFRELAEDRRRRAQMSRRGMELVDGGGTARVLEAIDQVEIDRSIP